MSDAKTLWKSLTHSLDGCVEDLPADLDYCETDCRHKDCNGDAFAAVRGGWSVRASIVSPSPRHTLRASPPSQSA